jgi:tyrosinase
VGTRLGADAVEVHVNVPQGGRPQDFADRRAGIVSMFGVVEASRQTARHSGSGIDAIFDITAIVRTLAASGGWDPAQLRVTFTPLLRPGEPSPAGDVAVGRVSLFYA